MNIEQMIYDVKEIKMAIGDDTYLEDSWLFYKVNNYRATVIPQVYALHNMIDPSWLQPTPTLTFTRVGPADDPAITVSSLTLGRTIIPAVVSLPEDLGINRISGSGGIIGFEPTDFDTLVMKATIKEEISPYYGYYARIGTMLYTYPYIMEGRAIIIAETPTDVLINDGTNFRAFTLADPYPLDAMSAQQVILQILTVDLKINEQSISDIVNDAQSNLKILKDVQSFASQKS